MDYRYIEAAALPIRVRSPWRSAPGRKLNFIRERFATKAPVSRKRVAPVGGLFRFSGTDQRPAPFASQRPSHTWQRTYGISTGTGSLELSVILFSPEIFTSNTTSETETPSEHAAITFTSEPLSWNDLTVHF